MADRQTPDMFMMRGQLPSFSAVTLMSADALMEQLTIRRIKLYVGLQASLMPQPSIRLGARSPRWLWTDVVQHLKCQQGRGGGHD